MRYKFRFIDLAVVSAATIAILFVATTTNIFSDAAGQTQKAEAFELDEMLLVCAVLLGGLVWALRRLLRERREAGAPDCPPNTRSAPWRFTTP